MSENDIEQLKSRIIELEGEIKYYKKILDERHIKIDAYSFIPTITSLSTNDKISVFMHYFKGRSDCYALRWEKEGKNGYAPAYTNGAKYLTKDQRKEIPFSKLYEPLTDDIIETHLRGNSTVGLYPMLSDQTCYFLALDFDEESWKKDVIQFSNLCDTYGIDHLIEISRSGKGAHLWIFFEEPMLAKDVRRLGRFLLTKTMMLYGLSSFKSYDRMFPTQDYIEKNGIGNLIALPLQGKSGKQGRTLFVDKNLSPHQDQYHKLRQIKKLSKADFDHFFIEVSKTNEMGPFSDTTRIIDLDNFDFSESFELVINSQIRIKKSSLSVKATQFFKRAASIINPDFYKKQNMRVSTYGIPRVIELYEETHEEICIPVGLLKYIKTSLDKQRILYEIEDLRVKPKMRKLPKFAGVLSDEQQNCMMRISQNPNGVVIAPTGFGKTVLGISLITRLRLKTLVIVNRINLAEQWIDKMNQFTDIKDIGRLYDGHDDLGHDVDIALIQSLSSYTKIDDIIINYGLIIIDEVHHLASMTYEKMIRRFWANHIIGLTATLKRSDGLEGIITTMIGPIVEEVDSDLKNLDKILTSRLTGFKLSNGSIEVSIQDAYQELCENEDRNLMIINDIKSCIEMKQNILVLTDRIHHLEFLEKEINKFTQNLLVVHGQLTRKEKLDFREKLSNQKENVVILATGKYIGEGFDDDRLDTLFLTMPFRWRGTLQQYVGRLNRTHNEKNQIHVYDYADIQVRYFSAMYLERLKGYKKMGYELFATKTIQSTIYHVNEYEIKLMNDIKDANAITFIVRNSNENILNQLVNRCLVKPQILIDGNQVSNIIVVDHRFVWYGSINPFVFKHKAEDDIMRYEDVLLAEELIKQAKSETESKMI